MFLLRLIDFLGYLVQLYVYIVIASVILSWLMAFGVVNPYNPTVRAIWQGLNAVTEPLLRPIRNILPNLGAIDLSPVVLLLLCFFVQSVVLGTLRDLVATAG
ncbi:MAG: YggT family protein [Hyphomicrobium sp.]|nr:YggT family protein [Hyphomicrobium sp.]